MRELTNNQSFGLPWPNGGPDRNSNTKRTCMSDFWWLWRVCELSNGVPGLLGSGYGEHGGRKGQTFNPDLGVPLCPGRLAAVFTCSFVRLQLHGEGLMLYYTRCPRREVRVVSFGHYRYPTLFVDRRDHSWFDTIDTALQSPSCRKEISLFPLRHRSWGPSWTYVRRTTTSISSQ